MTQDAPDLMAIIRRYCGCDILKNDAADWRYLSDVLEELIAQRVAEALAAQGASLAPRL